MLRPASALVLTALLLAGCGGTSDSSSVETRSTSAGRTTYDVGAAGFSIAVPKSWQALSADEIASSDEFESAIEETPALGPYAEALQGANSVLKFVALDPNVHNGFATNLNVLVEELPAGVTLDDYERAFISQLEALPSLLGDIEHQRVDLPAGEAVKATYRQQVAAGATGAVSTLQYVFVTDRAAYILTYTTPPDLADANDATFTESARSFRLT